MKFLYYTLCLAGTVAPFVVYSGLTHGWRKPAIVFGCMAAGYVACLLVQRIARRG